MKRGMPGDLKIDNYSLGVKKGLSEMRGPGTVGVE